MILRWLDLEFSSTLLALVFPLTPLLFGSHGPQCHCTEISEIMKKLEKDKVLKLRNACIL